MATVKLEKKVEELEGLVLANRFGARTIWGGFMITIVSTLLSVVVLLPTVFWAAGFAKKGADGKVILMEGGQGAVMVVLMLVLAFYVAMLIGVVRMVMGFYRMAHPEKYVERVMSEK